MADIQAPKRRRMQIKQLESEMLVRFNSETLQAAIKGRVASTGAPLRRDAD